MNEYSIDEHPSSDRYWLSGNGRRTGKMLLWPIYKKNDELFYCQKQINRCSRNEIFALIAIDDDHKEND